LSLPFGNPSIGALASLRKADATAVLGDVVTNFEMDVCLPP
jgi:hypothetical protein